MPGRPGKKTMSRRRDREGIAAAVRWSCDVITNLLLSTLARSPGPRERDLHSVVSHEFRGIGADRPFPEHLPRTANCPLKSTAELLPARVGGF